MKNLAAIDTLSDYSINLSKYWQLTTLLHILGLHTYQFRKLMKLRNSALLS